MSDLHDPAGETPRPGTAEAKALGCKCAWLEPTHYLLGAHWIPRGCTIHQEGPP